MSADFLVQKFLLEPLERFHQPGVKGLGIVAAAGDDLELAALRLPWIVLDPWLGSASQIKIVNLCQPFEVGTSPVLLGQKMWVPPRMA